MKRECSVCKSCGHEWCAGMFACERHLIAIYERLIESNLTLRKIQKGHCFLLSSNSQHERSLVETRAQRSSCTDDIATQKIIIKRSIDWQTCLRLNFRDFEKAFDSLRKKKKKKELTAAKSLMVWYLLIRAFAKAFYDNQRNKIALNGKIL